MSKGLEDFKDKYISTCPYCGSNEMIECYQDTYGSITATSHMLGGQRLFHSVCRNCGSVLRSYVEEPEKLLKRKDRRDTSNGIL